MKHKVMPKNHIDVMWKKKNYENEFETHSNQFGNQSCLLIQKQTHWIYKHSFLND